MGEFTDSRGIIRDLPIEGPIDGVTYIHTKQGAIRGNHVHDRTTQWTYITDGWLEVHNQHGARKLGPGMIWVDLPGEPHAWLAATDCSVLVFTRGPRTGEDYESDTRKLDRPLIV